MRSRKQLAENVLDLVISHDGRLNDQRTCADGPGVNPPGQGHGIAGSSASSGPDCRIRPAPEGLLEMLARDDISVAGPILQHSPLLEDTTLIEIVQLRTREHQLCIAMRTSLHGCQR